MDGSVGALFGGGIAVLGIGMRMRQEAVLGGTRGGGSGGGGGGIRGGGHAAVDGGDGGVVVGGGRAAGIAEGRRRGELLGIYVGEIWMEIVIGEEEERRDLGARGADGAGRGEGAAVGGGGGGVSAVTVVAAVGRAAGH